MNKRQKKKREKKIVEQAMKYGGTIAYKLANGMVEIGFIAPQEMRFTKFNDPNEFEVE